MKTRVAMMCALMLALSGCGGRRTAPEDLIGVWQTSEPKYVGRTMEITKRSIIFAGGDDFRDVNYITRVEEARQGGKKLYTITYENAKGDRFDLSLYYRPEEENGTIHFKYQSGIAWKRIPTPPKRES